MDILTYIIIGLCAGTASGLVGIGGGIIVTPALVLLLKMNQHQAQGTTLAMLVPPIGLLAAYEYYKNGYVDLKIAGLICIGFFIGGLIGARLAVSLSHAVLEKIFGGLLIAIGVKMLFFPKS